MFATAAVVGCLLALVLIGSGRGKLTKDPRMVENMAKVGVPVDKFWLLAAAEIAGAVGLVIGLFWWPVGVAAGVGVVLYFVGALWFHVRARDRNVAPALVLLLVAVAALVLRFGTR